MVVWVFLLCLGLAWFAPFVFLVVFCFVSDGIFSVNYGLGVVWGNSVSIYFYA